MKPSCPHTEVSPGPHIECTPQKICHYSSVATTMKAASFNPTQQKAVAAGVDLSSLPVHVAVIMDGNGRWAKRRGLGRLIGHREGYRTLRDVLLSSSELGLRY